MSLIPKLEISLSHIYAATSVPQKSLLCETKRPDSSVTSNYEFIVK